MLKNKMFIYYIMSRFNTNSTHPLIPNAQQYMFEQQYVSIHSEDRNILKYPNASEFEIELPQDYLNVQGARLASGYFPFTLYTFSAAKKNNTMSFKITEVYNSPTPTALELAIYNTLYNYIDNYTIDDILSIFNIVDPTVFNVTDVANALVAKMKAEKRPVLMDFLYQS